MAFLLEAAIVIVPLWVSLSARDPFRTPKLLLVRGVGLVLLALSISVLIRNRERIARFDLILVAIVAAWGTVTTLLSPSPHHSSYALMTLFAALGIFLASDLAGRERLVRIEIIIVPAAVLTLVAILQMIPSIEWSMAKAFVGDPTRELLERVSPITLLGNRNDLGVFLVVPTLVGLAFVLTSSGRKRWIALVLTLFLVIGLVLSRTATAYGALGIAAGVMLIRVSWKWTVAVFLAGALVLIGAVAVYQPLSDRWDVARRAIEREDWDLLLTRRVVAFMAAAEMIEDHPLTGVGPGRFGSEYYNYKIEATRKHGDVFKSPESKDVFTSAHSDLFHLVAVAGVPGGVLYLLAVAVTAFRWPRTKRDGDQDDPAPVARILVLPLMVSLLALGLAQYPLQLGVTILTYTYLGGICRAEH